MTTTDEKAPAPAEVPMPEPDAIDGTSQLSLAGCMGLGVMRVTPPYSELKMRTYGAACRAAGEAAGYARGRADERERCADLCEAHAGQRGTGAWTALTAAADRIRNPKLAAADAALLAHIQRGVPEGWQMVPKEPTREMCRAGLAERHDDLAKSIYTAMLAVAPLPDQFRDAAKMIAEPAGDRIAAAIHYPECWDTAAYPTIESALSEVFAHYRCTEHAAPAGVPMPKPVAYGFGNTAITGHTNRLMMVRIDIPGGDQYAGAFWLPLVLADEAHTYGVACRAAGEAAGYARGLRDAVRDADIEALRLYVRALCKAVDAATDFAGTVAGGASWWDDVWADHAAALDRARERISQAALRGEVKP